MLEFAIFIPLIVLLVAGVVDFGLALRRQQVIIAAAKEGARVGAGARGLPCGISSDPDPTRWELCDAVDIPTSLTQTAKVTACEYLAEAGLSRSKYRVGVVVNPSTGLGSEPVLFDQCASLGMGAGPAPLLRVTIESTGRNCFFCGVLDGSLSRIRGVSTFAIESNVCSGVGSCVGGSP